MTKSAPRIPPLASYDDEVAAILSKTLANPAGEPSNIFKTLARHPRLLARFNTLGGLFMAKSVIRASDRELIILRVATRTRCPYEWGQHVGLAYQAGLTAAQLEWLVAERVASDVGTSPLWTEDQRALMTVTDHLLDGTDVDDALWSALHLGRTDAQALEILMLAGFYRMLAAVINAVRVELDEGLPMWPSTAPRATTPR